MSEDDAEKEQILVIHEGELTDVVRMLAPAKMIREHHRKARITLLCGEEYEGLLKHCPYFNVVETNLEDTAKRNFFDRLKDARNTGFDIIYRLDGAYVCQQHQTPATLARTLRMTATPTTDRAIHPLSPIP